MPTEVLSLAGLTKRYGEVTAVDQLDLRVNAGEIVALVGENGAGKSTVVNMITGMTLPDEGVISLHGLPVAFASPRDALERGIGVVHQHYALVANFTVAETFALGHDGLGVMNRNELRNRVRSLAEQVGISIDVDAEIGSLDVAGQQRVEILKALSRKIDVLVLDEPTAVLTPEDAERLFAVVKKLSESGVAIILITHHLADVFDVCDRAIVMHAGCRVMDRPVADVTHAEMVSAMIAGRTDASQVAAAELAHVLSDDFDEDIAHGADRKTEHLLAEPTAKTQSALSVTNLALRRPNGSIAISQLSFDLFDGEILAIAGVDGNGQTELIQCLAGLTRPDAGTVKLGALESDSDHDWSPRALRLAGVAHVPDDRRRQGIVEALPLTDNVILSHVCGPRYQNGGIINRGKARSEVEAAIDHFGIRSTGADQLIGHLSGGNQQKLVLARELLADPSILLAAHPSRGLDIRTIAFVQETLRQRRANGTSILLVSADLGEIWGLADRVMVFAAGRARGPVMIDQTTREEVGTWMAGH